MLEALTVCITINCEIFLKEIGIQDHLICLLQNLYTGQEETVDQGMKQRTGSKLRKEYVKTVYCRPAYLTYMHSTS